MSRAARRPQSGQTLIMFAITMTFMFLALIALVGDADVLMVRYSQVTSEALIGVQAGATAVNEAAVYEGRQELDLDQAKSKCEAAAVPRPVPGRHQASCTAQGTTVTATVFEEVSLPIPLFVPTARVQVQRTGQAVFGGVTPVAP